MATRKGITEIWVSSLDWPASKPPRLQDLLCFCVCARLFRFLFLLYCNVRVPSVLWHCCLGLLTCKNRLPDNLYRFGGDVKPCSIQSSKTPSLVQKPGPYNCQFCVQMTKIWSPCPPLIASILVPNLAINQRRSPKLKSTPVSAYISCNMIVLFCCVRCCEQRGPVVSGCAYVL